MIERVYSRETIGRTLHTAVSRGEAVNDGGEKGGDDVVHVAEHASPKTEDLLLLEEPDKVANDKGDGEVADSVWDPGYNVESDEVGGNCQAGISRARDSLCLAQL